MALAFHTDQEEESRQVSHLGHSADPGKKPRAEGLRRCQSDVPFPVVLDQHQDDQVEGPGQEV